MWSMISCFLQLISVQVEQRSLVNLFLQLLLSLGKCSENDHFHFSCSLSVPGVFFKNSFLLPLKVLSQDFSESVCRLLQCPVCSHDAPHFSFICPCCSLCQCWFSYFLFHLNYFCFIQDVQIIKMDAAVTFDFSNFKIHKYIKISSNTFLGVFVLFEPSFATASFTYHSATFTFVLLLGYF